MKNQNNEFNQCGFQFDNSYLSLTEELYTKVKPTAVSAPKAIIINEELADSLGLDLNKLNEKNKATLFSGNALPTGATPFAQAYAGHQFGHFTMLGDGRAHILGEQIKPDGTRVDIQLKGSGQTPYSRRGDGRAALGPMLREYIMSEAMHALDIPTTRSLAVVTTGEEVIREISYPGAILTRVATSHIRVGTFELAAAKRDTHLVETLLNYTIERHFPDIKNTPKKALAFLMATMEQQIDLVVNWMRVGFIHGVMNTDNMAISGETIDYGPCAFMDIYHPKTVFSSIDHAGRYAYANQPLIAQWNLARLAEAILPLLDKEIDGAINIAKEAINEFTELYNNKWHDMMKSKLGLFGSHPHDNKLISNLLNWIQKNQLDYTNTFIDLSQPKKPENKIYKTNAFNQWYNDWQNRLALNKKNTTSALNLMKKNNPVIIPRNHNVEAALTSANEGNLKPFETILAALKKPYQNNEKFKEYQLPPEPSDQVYQTFCGT